MQGRHLQAQGDIYKCRDGIYLVDYALTNAGAAFTSAGRPFKNAGWDLTRENALTNAEILV